MAGRHFDKRWVVSRTLSKTGNGSWLLRYQRGGKEHWHGLGPLRDFELDEARERARKARQKLRDGVDPIAAKRAAEDQETAGGRPQAISFEDAAQSYYDAYQSKWSVKHRGSLHRHVAAICIPDDRRVCRSQAIDTGLVLSVLGADLG